MGVPVYLHCKHMPIKRMRVRKTDIQYEKPGLRMATKIERKYAMQYAYNIRALETEEDLEKRSC